MHLTDTIFLSLMLFLAVALSASLVYFLVSLGNDLSTWGPLYIVVGVFVGLFLLIKILEWFDDL